MQVKLSFRITKTGIGDDAVSSSDSQELLIYMPFAELVDIAKEKERLDKRRKTFKWRDQTLRRNAWK